MSRLPQATAAFEAQASDVAERIRASGEIDRNSSNHYLLERMPLGRKAAQKRCDQRHPANQHDDARRNPMSPAATLPAAIPCTTGAKLLKRDSSTVSPSSLKNSIWPM